MLINASTCNELNGQLIYYITHPEMDKTLMLDHIHTSKDDKVDLPHPLVPHNSTVTDSFLSLILTRTIGKDTVKKMHLLFTKVASTMWS
jgi:hypothetical protein